MKAPPEVIPEDLGQRKCSWPWLWGFIQYGVEVGMEAFAMGSLNIIVAGTVKIVARRATSEPNSLLDKVDACKRGDGEGAAYFKSEITGPAVFYILPIKVPFPYGLRVSVMPAVLALQAAAQMNPGERKDDEMMFMKEIVLHVAGRPPKSVIQQDDIQCS